MWWQYPQALDTALFVVQNREVQVEFTQSARKHRVGRARVRQVVMAVRTDRGLLVIHAMDLRPK